MARMTPESSRSRFRPLACSKGLTCGRAFALVAFAMACSATSAQTAQAPDCNPAQLQAQLQAGQTIGVAQISHCQQHAPWLAVLGRWHLFQGRYAEALEHLERALLLDPTQAPVQLDFAIALAGAGDTLSALGLVRQLQQEPNLPEALRQALQARVEQWQNPVTLSLGPLEQRQWRLQLGTRLGHDSNLLGAPNLQSITLQLFGLPVTLPLDDSYASQPGPYHRHDLALSYQQRHADRITHAQASLSQRNTPGLLAGRLQQASVQIGTSLGAPADWGWASADTRLYLQGQLASLLSGQAATQRQHNTAALMAGLDTSFRPSFGNAQGSTPNAPAPEWLCQQRHGLEWLRRATVASPVLDGVYAGLSSQWTCQDNRPTGDNAQAQLALRLGSDQPRQPERPGGAQYQASMRLGWQQDAGPGQLQIETELDISQDQRVYSDILAPDTKRRLQRHALRLQWQRPLGQGLQLQLGAEWQRQRSNIALFSIHNWGPYIALRWTP